MSENEKNRQTIVNCPTCSRPVEWNNDNKWRPFCSERCKLIDLGEWASESYNISGEGENEFSINPEEES